MVAKEHGESKTIGVLLEACKGLNVDVEERSPGRVMMIGNSDFFKL